MVAPTGKMKPTDKPQFEDLIRYKRKQGGAPLVF